MYLNSTLVNEEIDLTDPVLDTMTTYNGIAARNPHLQRTMSSSNEEIYVKAISLGDPLQLGLTSAQYYVATNRIFYATMSFNTQIVWNRSYDYSCQSIPGPPYLSCHGDADKVVRHEFGHAEGLAHVTHSTVAVMVVGEPASTYHGLQTDDRNGIIHIYGAYP